MNYSWCESHITHPIERIFELGSRDCLDAIALSKRFGCEVVAFECNPECIQLCKSNLSQNPTAKVTLIDKAVHHYDGKIAFNAFDTSKYDNVGASSVFEIDFCIPCRKDDADYGKTDVQKTISVDAVRLDSFIDNDGDGGGDVPTMIIADLQENELNAFQGLGRYLDDDRLQYIVTEASVCPTYKGGCSFRDIHELLTEHGFHYKASNKYGNGMPPLTVEKYAFFDAFYSR